MLHRPASWLAGLHGWHRLAAAALAGMLAVLALPPVHAVPVLLIALPALLWLLDGVRSGRGAFVLGWAFGIGYFVAGLYWIANALLIDVARFGWMIPFAVGGLSAALAVYPGLVALGVHRFGGHRGGGRVLVFAGLWTLMEGLRGWALTGFPWNPLGTVWMPVDAVVQSAAWVGVYGLTFLTVVVSAMPAVAGWSRGWPAWRPVAAAIGLLAVVAAAGAVRLPSEPVPTVPDVRLRLVQPNIPQAEKWQADRRLDNLRRHVALSRTPAPSGPPPTHVIWGETAVPYPLDGRRDDVRDLIAVALEDRPGPDMGPETAVITGAVRVTPPGAEPYRVWNSLIAVDGDGTVRAVYDKAHLVPFGEYVPFRDVLPLDKITPGSTDFSAGPGPRTVMFPGLPPASPLICYEVIFPGAVTDPEVRPAWLLNVTNDGWYGVSSGPYQHFATARLRAVEEGVPLVRVANTGISAIVDPYGRVLARVGLAEAGVADGPLPQSLPPTLFARLGNLVPLGLAALAVAGGAAIGRGRRVVPERMTS